MGAVRITVVIVWPVSTASRVCCKCGARLDFSKRQKSAGPCHYYSNVHFLSFAEIQAGRHLDDLLVMRPEDGPWYYYSNVRFFCLLLKSKRAPHLQQTLEAVLTGQTITIVVRTAPIALFCQCGAPLGFQQTTKSAHYYSNDMGRHLGK